MNVNMFKGKMTENELTQEQLSKYLDISVPSFRRRMNASSFRNDEIVMMARLLNLNEQELMAIFFPNLVS